MDGGSKMDAEEAGFKTTEMTLTAIVQSKSAKEIILETMEKEAFHYFIIFLVLIDLIILMVQQVLTLHHLEGYIHDEHGMEIGHEFLFILSCMVLTCFVVEIVLKIALLREEFLGDILNVMDTFVIFFSLPFEIYLHLIQLGNRPDISANHHRFPFLQGIAWYPPHLRVG
ncbi:hypothetical protein DSO57_1011013 [Entomophthora muscae]|uniref:Uncharacterized protein n=1 Tax=Entomophthora muscae TaxID=34485 RepID=A0ACC2S8E0_9FUNG|nr:hypothetical protein DSO57_1011013 [Entomophthora muscae]